MWEPTRYLEFIQFGVFLALVGCLLLVCFRRRSTVLRATQLKSGMWFVYWWTDKSAYWTENVQCGDISLQLFSRVYENKAKLSVKENQGETCL